MYSYCQRVTYRTPTHSLIGIELPWYAGPPAAAVYATTTALNSLIINLAPIANTQRMIDA